TGPDGEPGSQPGANADRDDNSGSAGLAEEDAWPDSDPITITQEGSALTRSIACVGTGTVAGWIDFNRNGTFDTAERAGAACSGGTAALSWNIAADVTAGPSYLRLRYASDPTEVQLPASEAADGEVEDHSVSLVLSVDTWLQKTAAPTTAAVGQ